MSAISLINSGVAWFVAAAVLAFLFSFQKALSGWIAGIGGAVGSLYTAAAGFTVLTGAVGVSGALSLVSRYGISPILRPRKAYCALAVTRKGSSLATANRSRRLFCCKNAGPA